MPKSYLDDLNMKIILAFSKLGLDKEDKSHWEMMKEIFPEADNRYTKTKAYNLFMYRIKGMNDDELFIIEENPKTKEEEIHLIHDNVRVEEEGMWVYYKYSERLRLFLSNNL